MASRAVRGFFFAVRVRSLFLMEPSNKSINLISDNPVSKHIVIDVSSEKQVSVNFIEPVITTTTDLLKDPSLTSSNTMCACLMQKGCLSSGILTPCSSPDCVYGYLRSDNLSYEQFKVQIGNVNRHISVKVMKKFLQAQGFAISKAKPVGRGFFFVTFRSIEDRDRAVEKLNGHVFRGRPLEVKVSMPASDPILLKKLQMKPKGDEGQNKVSSSFSKKRKLEDLDEKQESSNPNTTVAPLYQMVYDPDQLNIKQKSVFESLKKVRKAVMRVNKFKYCDSCLESGLMSTTGKTLAPDLCPITPSPILNGYRNKAKFTIGEDPNGKSPVVGVRLGRYKEGSTAVAYPNSAPIFSATTHAVIASFQACLDSIYYHPSFQPDDIVSITASRLATRLRVYDMIAKVGHWCSVTVRESRLGECLLVVEIRRGDLSDEDLADLELFLKQWFQPGGAGESVGVTSIYLVVLTGVSPTSGSSFERCIFGKETIMELCCGLKFLISKDAFFQVNTLATEKLYEEVRQRCKALFAGDAKLTNSAVLLDICCGTGTIGLCLADHFERVIGIELSPSAVENAKINAKLNGITNAQFYSGKAEIVLKDLIRTLPEDREIVAVLDPPRAGVNCGVIETIRRCKRIRHVVFVACDLAKAISNFEAFARPTSNNYAGDPFLPTLSSCVDLFPHTPAVEVVLSLKRLPSSDCDHTHEVFT